MFSPLPPSRQKRSIDNDIIGSGYYISVSSNGQDFTEKLTTIVYDSTCYDCNLTSLTCDELVIFIFYLCYDWALEHSYTRIKFNYSSLPFQRPCEHLPFLGDFRRSFILRFSH
jgi:hypothetical protein